MVAILSSGFGKWLTPRQVAEIAKGDHGDLAENSILDLLRAGFLVAIAREYSEAHSSREAEIHKKPIQIPSNYWPHLADAGTFWRSGAAKFYFGGASSMTILCVDVRFDPAKVSEHFTARPQPKPIPPPITRTVPVAPATLPIAPVKAPMKPASRAGRPPKDFWHDLLIATIKALWEGDWKPTTYAEVERWMADWASQNGHDISETALKAPAKKIFQVFCE